MFVQMFNDGFPELLEAFRSCSEGKLATKASTMRRLQERAGSINKSAQRSNRHAIAESVLKPVFFAQHSNQLTK